MKVGDTVPVMIAGQKVVDAKVTEMGDGTATLLIPGTIAVMAVRTEFAPDPVGEPETQHVVDGVEKPAETPEAPEAQVEEVVSTTPEAQVEASESAGSEDVENESNSTE